MYGFTKDQDASNYMVVMDYANKGNLRNNLTKIIEYSWQLRLYMLYKIISGLNEIHKINLIHCDFHDGNILNHSEKKDGENIVDKVYISDLGLCKPVKSFSKKDDIYGVMPFMAPEILRNKPYTQASDIYSFSMIMWEFTSGVPPYNDKAHDLQLGISICKGERPQIIENTPQCYMDLMKKCWNEDPSKRPSALEVKNIIGNWIFLSDKMKVKDINEKLKSNIMEFINTPIGNNKLITEIHPQACYTSRLLDFNSKKLNEILASECLDCMIEDIKSLGM
jgi:serine/threonine protein kinase